MINPTQAFLILVILSGVFGIFIGLNDRRNKGSVLTNKPFLRGCLIVASGSVVLALFLADFFRGWIAVTVIGVLIAIQEYAIMAIARFREQRTSPDHLVENRPLLEVKETETWQQVRKKGKSRFVMVNAALYGFSGVLLTCLAAILAPAQIPLYISISIILAGAVGGATAAIRQWNWQERHERSTSVNTSRKERANDGESSDLP
jgi:hypothetical protein